MAGLPPDPHGDTLSEVDSDAINDILDQEDQIYPNAAMMHQILSPLQMVYQLISLLYRGNMNSRPFWIFETYGTPFTRAYDRQLQPSEEVDYSNSTDVVHYEGPVSTSDVPYGPIFAAAPPKTPPRDVPPTGKSPHFQVGTPVQKAKSATPLSGLVPFPVGKHIHVLHKATIVC